MLIIGFLFTLTGISYAQDIHYSLYNMAPLAINPAQTGAYNGSYRIGGIYRDQYRTITGQQFSTPMIYFDAPLATVGKRQLHWIGVGGMFYQDNAGIAALKTNSFQLSAALHLALDENYKNVITIGGQAGPINRSIDLTSNALNFEDEVISGGGFGAANSADRLNDTNANYTDVTVGLLFKSKMNDKTRFNAGLSLGHLLQPNASLVNEDFDLSMRLQAHAGLTRQLTEKFSVSPSIYYTSFSTAGQFQVQALGGYLINEQVLLNFGLGYRANDAAQFILGANLNNQLNLALSYDLTVSELTNSRTGGAFEVAAAYIFKSLKDPDVKPVFLCPHL